MGKGGREGRGTGTDCSRSAGIEGENNGISLPARPSRGPDGRSKTSPPPLLRPSLV